MTRRNLVWRVALRAYPAEFRRRFGDELVQATSDLRRHGGVGRTHLVARTALDVARTAAQQRSEQLMSHPHVKLFAVALLLSVALVAAVVGSPALLVLVAAVVGLVVLVARHGRRPILPPGHHPHPYRWVAGGVAAFGVGFGVLVVDGGELTSAGWVLWALSWASATVLVSFGLVLALSRAVRPAA